MPRHGSVLWPAYPQRTSLSLLHVVFLFSLIAGIRGFYAGLQPTVVEIVPYIALHFTFYEGLKHLVRKYREDEAHKMTAVESFVAGGLSGMCSKLLTLPLDTVKKRMQVQGQFFVKSRYSSFGDVFVKVSDICHI